MKHDTREHETACPEKINLADLPGVWTHACGNQSFYLNDNGSITCDYCEQSLSTLQWTRARVQ